MWMWLAVQLPDGMAALWHWEYADGARVYTDGCFAPADGSDPVPVVDVRHALEWIDSAGDGVSYGSIGLDARGRWAQRYGDLGGGLNEVTVRTDDGREGTAIYELTGAHHHRYFPIARAERLPPGA
jgi:hypothetical protein